MSGTVLGALALHTFFTVTGELHPFAAGLPGSPVTAHVVNILAGALLVFFLVFLYRGSRPIRSLFGMLSVLTLVFFATHLAWAILNGYELQWIALDAFSTLAAGLAAWTALKSRSASRFFSAQDSRF